MNGSECRIEDSNLCGTPLMYAKSRLGNVAQNEGLDRRELSKVRKSERREGEGGGGDQHKSKLCILPLTGQASRTWSSQHRPHTPRGGLP